ncbi:hypothetical protein GCM10022276_12560 [Sphingomonas limnosediminicola]|uniref:Ice-binding protein C-terminal domain-containing protein n=1 Tax=Sphingomonas limnosediminicola TaxID=940133 RepID=A0ABP7L9K1_9SPHN
MTAPSFNRVLFSFIVLLASTSASAADFHFSTGSPDSLMATASRPASGPTIEIETADDFLLPQETVLTSGTFTGLIPIDSSLSDVQNVVVEIYRIFPLDSSDPPSGDVPSRINSPSNVAFLSRDVISGALSFSGSTISSTFTAANSVIAGINPSPNSFTGGEGPVRGSEVLFTFDFLTPVDLQAGHYFFVPQVQLAGGDFLWLSAPHGIGATPDLQTWIRNGNLAPDWLRIGTDITHQGPFNAAFSLDGYSVPEPSSWTLMLAGFGLLGLGLRRKRNVRQFRAESC